MYNLPKRKVEDFYDSWPTCDFVSIPYISHCYAALQKCLIFPSMLSVGQGVIKSVCEQKGKLLEQKEKLIKQWQQSDGFKQATGLWKVSCSVGNQRIILPCSTVGFRWRTLCGATWGTAATLTVYNIFCEKLISMHTRDISIDKGHSLATAWSSPVGGLGHSCAPGHPRRRRSGIWYTGSIYAVAHWRF